MSDEDRPLVPGSSPPRRAVVAFRNRSIGNSCGRRRSQVRRGNANALQHGVFAITGNARDVAVEVALIYATHPGLDDLADRRQVEQLALASVQHRRCLIAMEKEGITSTLSSYSIRLSQLIERTSRAVAQAERDRLNDKKRADSMVVQLQKQARR